MQITKGINTVFVVILSILIYGLLAGTLLGLSVFSSLTIINTTELSSAFSGFVTALIGFVTVTGTIIAIVWFFGYIKPLFDKKKGVTSFSGA